ncbi:MAG: cbb3-type cytochrome c oxidase subunit 3 [Gammaproteobacteria bacterium]|nr:cbb3-type cytochrome c oxidase subunit 3 [Gammaproteobacteria bacterium]NND54206.1 cbb3-type cytochrome c oxidase subunit 3 [Gammaproteobacteria bacterium]
MDAGLLRGLYTLFMFLAFAGIVWWAWSARRKADFDDAAGLPLEDDDLQEHKGDRS